MPTRRLHVPTIGEVLTLAKDWTFTVIAEYRNGSLMNYMKDAGVIPPDAPDREQLPECGATYEHTWPGRPERVARYGWETYMPATPDRVEQLACRLPPGHDGVHNYWDNRHRDYARYACTMPAGQRLRVDRIYIRKGKSEYDSLTFWAQDLGTRKKVRFFARLADVNTIEVTDGPAPRRVRAKPAPLRAILLRE